MSAMAFTIKTDAGGGLPPDGPWTLEHDAPCVVACGDDDFLWILPGTGRRAYVNGYPVAGLHCLRPDDFVRIYEADRVTWYRYAGRPAAAPEPGGGRPCAFTGQPILEGRAVRCPRCGALVSEAVMEQVGKCVCEAPLALGRPPSPPPEELL